MSKPFIIWTLRRTGGTALTDLLMEMSEYETIDHEPFNTDRKFNFVTYEFLEQKKKGGEIDIHSSLDKAFQSTPLIKHAYDTVDPLFNELFAKYIKSKDYKHIFLTRKDEVSRVLSLFMAYQSGVWGKHGSESVYEAIRSGEKTLEPFDLEGMMRNLLYAAALTKQVRSILDRESINYRDVYFEDFYIGEEDERREKLYALLEYLEFDGETIYQYRDMIWHILFNRDQKSRSVLEFVPNYTEAREMLESIVDDISSPIERKGRVDFSSLSIKLYLGAHKTATTHLQGILIANREKLSENGIKLSAPQNIRKGWLPDYFRFCNKNDRDALKSIRSFAPEKDKWILTEENIAGVSNDFAAMPGMYPNVGKRLRCIREAFPGADIELFFSIRSYGAFYRSTYSEVVRNRGYVPFSEFYDEDRFAENSWVDMVRMFAEVLPQDKITLWCFEDFRGLVPELLQRMTGIEDTESLISAYRAETTRPSLSQKTMDILQDLYPVLNREESKKLVERINRAYPVSDGYAPLQVFDKEQTKRFYEQYRQDVEKIREEFPRINFLGDEASWI